MGVLPIAPRIMIAHLSLCSHILGMIKRKSKCTPFIECREVFWIELGVMFYRSVIKNRSLQQGPSPTDPWYDPPILKSSKLSFSIIHFIKPTKGIQFLGDHDNNLLGNELKINIQDRD
jgi:hypothetical protein